MKSQGLEPLGGQLPYCDFKCQQDSVRGIQETREELADRREETWGGPWRRAVETWGKISDCHFWEWLSFHKIQCA